MSKKFAIVILCDVFSLRIFYSLTCVAVLLSDCDILHSGHILRETII